MSMAVALDKVFPSKTKLGGVPPLGDFY